MKSIVMVGSEALRAAGIETFRPRLDIDFIATEDRAIQVAERFIENGLFGRLVRVTPTRIGMAYIFQKKVLEFEIVETSPLGGKLALQIAEEGSPGEHPIYGLPIAYASPEFVYTLKMSHRYLKNSPAFLKTMNDIHTLRDRGRGQIVDEEFYRAREAATYDYGHPNLKVSKSDFFKPDVPYVYDHDTIHEAVAVMDRPAYTFYMADGAEVLTSKLKFFSLPRHVQLYGVLEESYVLALERSIIPHKTNPKGAFDVALSKVCTSITSGWFREFAWENYRDVRRLYNSDFVDKFEAALAAGRIKPFAGSTYGK